MGATTRPVHRNAPPPTNQPHHHTATPPHRQPYRAKHPLIGKVGRLDEPCVVKAQQHVASRRGEEVRGPPAARAPVAWRGLPSGRSFEPLDLQLRRRTMRSRLSTTGGGRRGSRRRNHRAAPATSLVALPRPFRLCAKIAVCRSCRVHACHSLTHSLTRQLCVRTTVKDHMFGICTYREELPVAHGTAAQRFIIRVVLHIPRRPVRQDGLRDGRRHQVLAGKRHVHRSCGRFCLCVQASRRGVWQSLSECRQCHAGRGQQHER